MSGTIKPDGHGTQPGCRTIDPILPLEPYLLDDLPGAKLKLVRREQLQYAADVCTRAAAAYAKILAIIDGP